MYIRIAWYAIPASGIQTKQFLFPSEDSQSSLTIKRFRLYLVHEMLPGMGNVRQSGDDFVRETCGTDI